MKTRFAPSPTGLIHLGNARAALFNVLLARRHQGCFLLRVEDTDLERSKTEYVDALQKDLKWLHLDWQEGPYFQSERSEIYETYYQMLIDRGLAFPCFCSEDALELARKLQRARGLPPRYPGTCRHLSAAEVEAKLAEGIKPALRFHMPEGGKIEFRDALKGEQVIQNNDIGDFIIRRSDGSASFMFCNAIDDALMKVDMVLRGEDHLTNSPRQIAILQALGLPQPQYAHLPLILGGDGSPLSKRNGSRSIEELRNEGFLPLAVFNYLARLGHHYESAHLMTEAELSEQFDLAHVSSSPARFDEAQLRHWQKETVMNLNLEEARAWLGPVLQKVPEAAQAAFVRAILPNILFPKEAAHWAEIFYGAFQVAGEHYAAIQAAGSAFFRAAAELASLDEKMFFKALQEKTGVKGRALFLPIRLALTGEAHGPDMAEIFTLLGPSQIKLRLAHAADL